MVTRPTVPLSGSSVAELARSQPSQCLAVPDYIQPVVGWRTWVWDERHGLVSPLGWTRWLPGEPHKAKCSPTTWMTAQRVHGRPHVPAHDPPGPACVCGIYACPTPPPSTDLFLKGDVFVAGLVTLWGRVVEHESGWRAEFAYPRTLFTVTETLEAAGGRQLARCLTELREFAVPVATVRCYGDLGGQDALPPSA